MTVRRAFYLLLPVIAIGSIKMGGGRSTERGQGPCWALPGQNLCRAKTSVLENLCDRAGKRRRLGV